ncbi:hypothetical protein [Xylophilus ampelinus]|uniref:Uncharacterized protein n=1 Tax=Xylophilus ampelinus TaxID=54067 RepID=A0A318SEU1_9BURK|nr:hypothetical protein [Xylophilus ampelinus]MCS4511512.1 hypothetical protein [Xylophilus ampelinus]PYE74366.1 hypothetical protein DFQ15_12539 [Xylophilus ampelinus]
MRRFQHRSPSFARSLRATVLTAVAFLSAGAFAQISPGAAAAASAGGSSASANGGTGGVGLGGVGPGVTVNPGVNSGAGTGVQGREQGSGALSGPRARRDAQAVAAQRGEAVPERAGQRALMLDQTRREPLGSLSNPSGPPGPPPPSGRNTGSQ